MLFSRKVSHFSFFFLVYALSLLSLLLRKYMSLCNYCGHCYHSKDTCSATYPWLPYIQSAVNNMQTAGQICNRRINDKCVILASCFVLDNFNY